MTIDEQQAAERVAITGVGQVAVTAHDLDRAIAFYRDVLELPFLFQIPNSAFFDCGGLRLMVGVPEAPEFDHPASILYYRVEDIQGAWSLLMRRGVRPEHEPRLLARMPAYDLWMAFFRDSEGNLLALMSEVPNGS